MTKIDLDALTTPDLFGELCDIIERNYQQLPPPGAASDDDTRHTSDEARAAANAILDAIYRAAGVERSRSDLTETVRGSHPGHTDEWYAAYQRRAAHYRSGGDMRTAPKLPDEPEPDGE